MLPDDAIAAVLAEAGVACFRGSHLDVLGRFLDATAGLAQRRNCCSLTADNVFPDGAFVDDLIDAFIRQELEYLGTDSPAGWSAVWTQRRSLHGRGSAQGR
jgi:spore coat polysaccharide biosynthesis protein SpsF